ncbi:hypothetical protein A3732_14705 [Oleiphilus sp. HI0050]|nr:hypothetical protein A3732_14705 [Oleiphilus sp. HI0050]
MKYKKLISTIALGLAGLACTSVQASQGTLHTFAEGQITSQALPDSTMLGQDNLPSGVWVSNNGVVAFAGPSWNQAGIWRADQADTIHKLDNVSVFKGLSADGEYIFTGLERYRWQDNGFQLTTKLFGINGQMSSDGRLLVGADNGAGVAGGISHYPIWREIGGNHFSFMQDFTRTFGGSNYPVEQTSKGLYENMSIKDIDGTAEIFLTRTLGTFSILGGYSHQDLILMDRAGRYRSEPFGATHGKVALSNNAEVIMARRYDEQCPGFNGTVSGRCAVIWVRDQGIFPIGDFYAQALGGDGRTVIGSTFSSNDMPSIPVIWDDVNGMRNFVSAINDDYGIDLSGWSDLHPLAISKDSSRIAGHGINPNGNREGFMITRPEKAAAYWASTNEPATQFILDANWQSSAGGRIESSTAGATASYAFEGTKLRFFGSKGKDKGQVDVYIDDVFWKAVDLYQCTQDDTQLLFESDYLGDGKHTLKLIANGLKNKASSGTHVSVDAIEVETTPPLPFAPFAQNQRDVPAAAWEIYDFGTKSAFFYNVWKPFYPTKDMQFSQVINQDGSFTIESWFKDTGLPGFSIPGFPLQAVIADISYQGKYLSIYITDDNNLGWTGQAQGGSVLAPLKAATNEWDHLVVSGNWAEESATIYLNNELVGDIILQPDERASEDLLRIGGPLDFSTGTRLNGQTAKFAAYPEVLTSTHVNELYNRPTSYGLEFAPIGSPEYSTRLPGCSQGCEPGRAVTNFYELSGGTIGGIGGIGGGF